MDSDERQSTPLSTESTEDEEVSHLTTRSVDDGVRFGNKLALDALLEPEKRGVVATITSMWSILATNPTWQRLPNWVRFGCCNVLAQLISFWGPNICLAFCYKYNLFSRYKIQPNKMPAPGLVREALVENLKATPGMGLLAWPLYKMLTSMFFGKGKAAASDSDSEGEGDGVAAAEDGAAAAAVGERALDKKDGWAQLHFGRRNMPSWKTMAWQVAVSYIGYDLMFYLSHRALHSKQLYMSVHKQHHRFSTSIGLASSYQHPVEGAVQMLNWFLPVGLAGYLNGGLHVSTLFAYNCFRWLETVDAHCGFIFPFSPFAVIPFFGGARAHDLHHSGEGLVMSKLADGTIFADFGNYGASVLWDRLLGTAR